MAFIPYEKMSKRQKKEEDRKRRKDWGLVSPVTKRIESQKSYNRKKDRKGQEHADGGLFCWSF